MTLEEKIAAANSVEEIREIMKSHLAENGIIERETGGNGVRILTPPTVVERTVTKPEDTSQLLRRIVTVHGESRLLTAYSVSGLDTLEKAFRAEC